MSAIWEVPAQEHATGVLRDAVESDAVGHAWAVIGPAGVGQEHLTRSLVAAVNCDVAVAGCGTCQSCVRSLRGAHPAAWEFLPTGAVHRVGDVRDQWMHVASRTAGAGHVKVLRVVDADRMNDAAANAFLKVLEEPPPRTVWVLELADPDELPDTILSRCRVVRVSPWDADTLRAVAAAEHPEVGATDVELAVRASMGSPDRMRALLTEDGRADLRRHREIPRDLRERGPGHALVAAQQLGDEMKRAVADVQAHAKQERAQLEEFYGDAAPRDVVRQLEQRATRREREVKTTVAQATLDDLAGWYRDVLLVRGGGDPADAMHVDAPDGLRADADALDERALLSSLDAVFTRREELELNVQVALAVEALLLDLWSIAAEA